MRKVIELISEANEAGAGLWSACVEIGICLRTLKRWRRAFVADGDGKDRRKGSPRLVVHRLSEQERQRILLTCNQPAYASLPPGQIVPALADQGLYFGSESSFYRVLHQAGQCHRRERARLTQEPRSVPRLRADGPNQVWSWDISFLPTTVRGVWLYLYLVVDVWSRLPGRKPACRRHWVVASDVAELESADIAADLVQRACLREHYRRPSGFGSHQSHQPRLILHADNGNAMRGATLEWRLEEMGVLRSCSRPRVSNDNPYSESLFRTVKYRPDYPSRPSGSKGEACEWVAAFVNWYNHRHRQSGIKFVTPHQSQSKAATAICQQGADVYETARQANPTRWSRSTCCWRQPEEVWINKPTEEPNPLVALPLIQGA